MTPDELRALADAATPGPWLIAYADGSGERDITTAESRVDYSVPNVVNGGEDDWGIPHGVLRPEDARLIALAPSLARDHAALLRAVADRVKAGHNDTCAAVLETDTAHPCSCGHDALAEWAEMQERPS